MTARTLPVLSILLLAGCGDPPSESVPDAGRTEPTRTRDDGGTPSAPPVFDAGPTCDLRGAETCEPGGEPCCRFGLRCLPFHDRHVCGRRLAEGEECRPYSHRSFDICDEGLSCTDDPDDEPPLWEDEELFGDGGTCESSRASRGSRFGEVGPDDPTYHAPLGHGAWTHCRPDADRYYYDAWDVTNVGDSYIHAHVDFDRRVGGMLLLEYGSFDPNDPTDEDGFCDIVDPERDQRSVLSLAAGSTRTVVLVYPSDVSQGVWTLDGPKRYKIYFAAEGPVEVVPHARD
ncbi:MAG TPA: hypothetical protein RMH99_24920 [Sandaracinaceae bacterium LLY-WYZ-13_1]|nr:hypothetical protein [Sandaracinaceae bacterium LLY-WYZ-13_1]